MAINSASSARFFKRVRKVSRKGRFVRCLLLGIIASLATVCAYRAGLMNWAELQLLDFRFRHISTIEPADEIIYIDLDDKSLEQIGRWPWPRRKLAQLIDVLNSCNARMIVLDIILPQPQQPRFIKEGITDIYSADTATVLNIDAPPVPVFDDAELAKALSASKNVFLATHIDMNTGDSTVNLEKPNQQLLKQKIISLLHRTPDAPLDEIIKKTLANIDPGSERFDIARRIYLRQRALYSLRRLMIPAPLEPGAHFPAGRLVPPMVIFAQVIAHTGFVTVVPDSDKIVRRIPPLAKTDCGTFPQLGLSVALQAFSARHGEKYTLTAGQGKITIAYPDGFTREIPLDARGCMIINWSKYDPARHISAVAVADVWQARQALQRNLNLVRQACIEIARSRGDETVLKPAAKVDEVWKRLVQARLKRQSALLYNPPAAASLTRNVSQLEKTLRIREAQLDRACKSMLAELDTLLEQIPKASNTSENQTDKQERRILWLRELIRRAEAQKPEIQTRLEQAINRLREKVAGKICLVGSTSTGAADLVPTPINKCTPGVVVHGNALNTILKGKFIRRPGASSSVILILLMGITIAVIISTLGPIESSLLLIGSIGGYLLIIAGLWSRWTFWTVTASPVAAMLASFVVITTYRQFTEQRQRRQITNTFKQYLSPAMVDRLVDDPSQAALGGQKRQLSCLFSDLAGFTALSERLGAERTVNVLNRYLDKVGQVLQLRHGGTLSKYEGDGIFVFFGAPIQQDDHANRAILAAIDSLELLPEINHILHSENLLPAEAKLSCRMGITSGEVFVGNMGSSRRIAYTAIGDAVNLASRLEQANKFFGTKILVNETAWELGKAGIIGRLIGKIIVVGKTEPVIVWEPLARQDDADGELCKFAADFTHGVELYSSGDFRSAERVFREILTRKDDPTCKAYLQFCKDAAGQPRFDGVIHLTEK